MNRLLFVIIIFGCCLCTVESQRVVSHSATKLYFGVTNRFTIIGENFQDNKLLVLNVNGYPFVDYTRTGDQYVWKFTDPERSQDICQVNIIYDGNKVFPLDSDIVPFEVIRPKIDSISPDFYYPNGVGNKEMVITGENFLINYNNGFKDDELFTPYVSICDKFASTLESTDTMIRCSIPLVSNLFCPVTVYTVAGAKDVFKEMFAYVEPSISSLSPEISLSTLSTQVITLIGQYFATDASTVYQISLNSIESNALFPCVVNSVLQNELIVSCSNFIANNDELFEIVGSADGQAILSTHYFYVAEPIFKSFKPKSFNLRTNGENYLYIEGDSFEGLVTKVTIGNNGVCKLIDISLKKITCRMPFAMDESGNLPLQVYFNDHSFSVGAVFISFSSTLSMYPSSIPAFGTWDIDIFGFLFSANEEVFINGRPAETLFVSIGHIKFKYVNSEEYASIGTSQITIKSSLGLDSYPALSLNVFNTRIVSVEPNIAYIHSQTEISITLADVPDDYENLRLTIDGNTICDDGDFIDDITLKCQIQPSSKVEVVPIVLSINNIESPDTSFDLKYAEPTSISIDSNLDVNVIGGDNLKILGENLDYVSKIQLGSDIIEDTLCVISPSIINCVLPPNVVGEYVIYLISIDSFGTQHSYNTRAKVTYSGLSVTKIEPSQGSMKKSYNLIITGSDFTKSQEQPVVLFDGVELCTTSEVQSDSVIKCTIPQIQPKKYQVQVKVNDQLTLNQVSYTSHGLSCLGQSPQDDPNSNTPVDWWFIYKLGNSADHGYLYIDSTTDPSKGLKRYSNIQHYENYKFENNPSLSPIESTFNQYNEYYYLFVSDQAGARLNDGRVNKDIKMKFPPELKDSKGNDIKVGHIKSIVLFDDVFKGVHIQHSNTLLPSGTKDGFNGPESNIRFLGENDYSQHFFCYSVPDVHQVTDYIIQNFGFIFGSKYPTIPEFSFISEMLTYKSSLTLREKCRQSFRSSVDLNGICYWKSDLVTIGGNLNAFYFSKIGIMPGDYYTYDSPFRSQVGDKRFDGMDIWMIIGDHFKRKLFVAMYYTNELVPYLATNLAVNVAELNLPQYLARPSNQQFSEYSFKTGTYVQQQNQNYGGNRNRNRLEGEHSKLGFPVYPTYGDSGSLDNYFCVGDLNRHRGQGKRGGGAICFQHPTLVYQFNRMVRSYESYYTLDGIVRSDPSRRHNSIGLFYPVTQPIKMIRPNDWTGDIQIEIKDFIGGNHYSQLPAHTHTVSSTTIQQPFDIPVPLQSLRKDKAYALKGDEEVIDNDNDVPPLLEYVSNDLLSIHYIAYDVDIGSVCDYSDNAVSCTSDQARRTWVPYPIPDEEFPPSIAIQADDFKNFYKAYSVLNARLYDMSGNSDFNLLKFTSRFNSFLSARGLASKKIFYQYLVGDSPSYGFYSPFILLSSDYYKCDEFVAYFMTLQFIYENSKATSPDDIKLFVAIGESDPNWANGVIFAISKVLLNEFHNTPNDPQLKCYLYDNMENYPMDSPFKDFRKSAGAAWDWMNTDSISNGDGQRIERNSPDSIPAYVLINLMIKLSLEKIDSMDIFSVYLPGKYRTNVNIIDIFKANNIVDLTTDVDMEEGSRTVFMRSAQSLMDTQSTSIIQEQQSQSLYEIARDEVFIESNFDQLLSIDSTLLNNLTIYQLEKLEQSMNKWININGRNQAIKVLLLDPKIQYHDQPIKFVEELNRGKLEDSIDLSYQSVGTSGMIITLNSTMSIPQITYTLVNIITSRPPNTIVLGNLEVYYLPKPANYNGYISSSYDGLIISTFNSLICDIQMITQSDYGSNNFDSICSDVGPIITSISQSSGSTKGGFIITINGLRFNSSMSVSIGENECLTTELVSSQQITCEVPNGVGKSNEIIISTQYSIFNIHKSKFIFSYDSPIISSVNTFKEVSSFEGDIITIYGSNFGYDSSQVRVLIDERFECTPIINITSDSIECISPGYVGDDQMILITVRDQSSKYDLNNLVSQSFSFDGPQISAISPENGDPTNLVSIIGEGFGDLEDIPIVYLGGKVIDITNYTNEFIEFQLDYETSNQTLIVQVGDQSFETTFSYYPPVITQLRKASVKTTGGLLELDGVGLGYSFGEITINFKSTEIECNSFDQFIECPIPPGVGSNIPITVAHGNEALEFLGNNSFSYQAPTFSNHLIIGNSIYIRGTNFVPVDCEETVGSDSYIDINFEQFYFRCNTFQTSKLAVCTIPSPAASQTLSTIEIIVGGQTSGVWSNPE